jgi:hypothetical protein
MSSALAEIDHAKTTANATNTIPICFMVLPPFFLAISFHMALKYKSLQEIQSPLKA